MSSNKKIKSPMIFRSRQCFVDILAWATALPAASMIRLDFDATRIEPAVVGISVVAAAAMQFVLGWLLGLYRYKHPYGSRHEVQTLFLVVVAVGLTLTVGRFFGPASDEFPRSVPFIALLIGFVLMVGVRLLHRMRHERMHRPSQEAAPTLVFGAGHLGQHVLQLMNRDRYSPFRPVGLIDDDPMKRNLRLDGTRVLGTHHDLTEVTNQTGAEVLIFAVARADAELLRSVSDYADAAGLRLLVLPLLSEIFSGKAELRDLRDVSIEDIIGRHPVDTDVDSIAGYIAGKRILVTGAGGSIGSELCRQLVKFNPLEVIMLDRDESGLHGVQMSISGHGLLDTDEVVLADIRDEAALGHIFRMRKPQVVFHAAALKHLPMLEQYPAEAWKTNVEGTQNVLDAALSSGVETFINISTDKAADPTSVLGFSKRTAEQLTAYAASTSCRKFLSVRFGNVLGSRGSMLPTFMAQIDAGGPVTVTDPAVTRYFMTIPEACQLVIQAGAIGSGGETLVLDMGEPVRILDVAQRMIDKSGADVDIVFTGLRDGEKLHENLVARDEADARPLHPKISHTKVPALSPEELDESTWLSGFNKSPQEQDDRQDIGTLKEVL